MGIGKNVSIMSPDEKIRTLPYVVLSLLKGFEYSGQKGDSITFCDMVLHENDFNFAQDIAKKVQRDYPKRDVANFEDVLFLHKYIVKIIQRKTDKLLRGKTKVIMLKDKSGCGWWRMALPARYMDKKKFHIDLSEAAVDYDQLLDYDTVYMMRLASWEEFYVIERLKNSGVHLVYDIDDDIFTIPHHNSASSVYNMDAKQASVAIMNLCDVVTVTSNILRNRLELEGVTVPIKVIPNALDPKKEWVSLNQIGSPDGCRRLLWQGSGTHIRDWYECADAVDEIMKRHDDLRVTILGFLPPQINAFLKDTARPWWNNNRIEYSDFVSTETYFQLIPHLRAEVAIAPLQESEFNKSKSCCKFLEYSCIGVPVVASDCLPYSDVITHEDNGFLVLTKEEWIEAIEECLSSQERRQELVKSARKVVKKEYDIRKWAKEWETVLNIENKDVV